MNYYRRFPGDYAGDTKHLTMLEHGAYTLLLDHLYATEKPIMSLQAALRICGASTKREKIAVDLVLSQFFYTVDATYRHKRVDEELSHAESKREAAQRSANARWNAPQPQSQRNANALPTQCSPDSRLQTPEKEEPKTIPAPKAVRASEPIGFLKFWEAYPLGRRVDRKDALRAWMKGGLELFADQILAGLTKWIYCEQWGSDQFIPHPATFLNKRRWEAEPPRETVNREALVGKFDPAEKRPEPTPEELARFEAERIDVERWDALENGTLPLTAETVAWVKGKIARLKGVRLTTQDPRPKWFKDFLARATAAGVAA